MFCGTASGGGCSGRRSELKDICSFPHLHLVKTVFVEHPKMYTVNMPPLLIF